MVESIGELLAFALSKNWTRYRMCLKQCQKKPRASAVHDLRTSIRRLIASLRLSEEVLRPQRKEIARVRKALKVELHLLRSLRDYQVQLKSLKGKKEFAVFLEFLCTEIEREQKRVSVCLKKKLANKIQKVEKRLLQFHAELLDHVDVQWDRKAALRLLNSAHHDVLIAAKKADPNDPASVHRTRIEFKKFRYEREVLAPLLKEPLGRSDQLDDIQTAFGDIQDHETLIHTAELFLTGENSLPKRKRNRASREGHELIALESVKRTRLMEELLQDQDIEAKLKEIKPVRKLQSA